jgi:ABC-type lipoprotein export system ATPase subunit
LVPLIEARSVEKSYPVGVTKVSVLRQLDLVVDAGEMVAVVGASGVGKSTLLHVLGGLDAIDGGSVRIGDIDLATMKPDELTAFRNKHVGFVFQFHHLLPEFSALENAGMPMRIARLPAVERDARARALLERVGLGERLPHKPGMLSGGEQQRVAIARALVMEPRLLLADEPTGDLDAKSAGEVLTLLQRLNDEYKKTIVMVTHDPHAAERAKRVLHLEKGTLVEAQQVG